MQSHVLSILSNTCNDQLHWSSFTWARHTKALPVKNTLPIQSRYESRDFLSVTPIFGPILEYMPSHAGTHRIASLSSEKHPNAILRSAYCKSAVSPHRREQLPQVKRICTLAQEDQWPSCHAK